MGNVIGEGRFLEKIPKNGQKEITLELYEKIKSGGFGKNVVILHEEEYFFQETDKYFFQETDLNIDDYRELVIEIIDNIIVLGIEKFLKSRLTGTYGNLLMDTIEIWHEMGLIAEGIEKGIYYVEGEEDFPYEYDISYYLEAINHILNPYQERVFDELNKKYKSIEQ